MYLVGLTGGIGSGKSTVAARLAELGTHVVDADVVAREVVEPGTPGLADIVDRFGPDVVAPDGSLDRAALAAIVFSEEEARTALNAITHPRIADRIAQHIAAHARAERDEPRQRIVVIDHPLLLETGQAAAFPAVVVVLAPEELRLERVVTSRGMDPDDARARLRAQVDDDARRSAATHVITNDGDLPHLYAQVDAVHASLRAAADAPPSS
ncbi:MAG: dephospho-CoA kinase, long form [Actinobacteria bacterium]|nr:dephospho-CoA kinase, long form [Actinomycetota bacterium]